MSEHHYIFLLQQAHDLIRNKQTRTPTGTTTPDADALAHAISNYLITVSTHSPFCWSWGPSHYACACARVRELEKRA